MNYFASDEAPQPRGPRVPCLITTGTSIPKDPTSFHAYLAEVGWKLHHDYRLEAHPSRTSGQSLSVFLQSWLFFGLVSATVRAGGGPILQAVDLVRDGLLDTSKLGRAFREWAQWEMENPKGRPNRQIEIAYMLSTAKHVVRRNFGLDVFTKHVGYSASNDDPQHVSDELALLLMVIGETLSAVSRSIMDATENRMVVANDDLDEGWGPSRWAFAQMEKYGWCPHDVRRVHNHFGSQATPLLSTYMASERNTSFMVQHRRRCTENVCIFRERQWLRGLQSNRCLPDCKIANTGSCGAVGPDMTAILNILLDRDLSSRIERWSRIPVLRFRSPNPDQSNPIELEVHRLEVDRLESQDVGFDQLVAISHAWNDDWDNDQANKLSSCRLRYLQRMMQDIGHGRDLYFWLDTLIVPALTHEKDSKRDQARENAMSPIMQIFQHAKHIVVLDEALPRWTAPCSPAIVTGSLLNRAWMGSLLALQGVYVNAEQNDTGGSSNSPGSQVYANQFLRGKHGLRTLAVRYLTRNGSSDSSIASVKQKHSPYSRDWHTSGKITKEGNEFVPGRDMDHHIIVIVNGLQVAKWETKYRIDEKLALATLLSIESRQYQRDNTPIEPDIDAQSRMARFWKMIHNEFPGSIPADIIFLHGDQLRLDSHLGFGWAPFTGESRHTLELSGTPIPIQGDTDLIPDEGLLVTFPGILLQIPSQPLRRELIGRHGEETISFPVSSKGLDEWYSIVFTTRDQSSDILVEVVRRETKLGIIAADGPESTPTIALLVEIYGAASSESDSDYSSKPLKVIHKCQIIRQVQLRREPTCATLDGFEIIHLPAAASRQLTSVLGSRTKTTFRSPQGHGASYVPQSQIFFAEWTSNKQKWIVDGYNRYRGAFLMGGNDGGEYKTVETRPQTRYRNSPSPLEKARPYWRLLDEVEHRYPPLDEAKTLDLEAHLIAVTSSAAVPMHESLGLPQHTSNQGPSFWSESRTGSTNASGFLPTGMSYTLLADVPDLAIQEITDVLIPQLEARHVSDHSLEGSFRGSLTELVRLYAVLLWHSAYEAWESELALLVENNVHRICDALTYPVPGDIEPVHTIRRGLTSSLNRPVPVECFLARGHPFMLNLALETSPISSLLTGLDLITSERNLSFAVHVHDEFFIQNSLLSKTQSTQQPEDADLSPMQLALSWVNFFYCMGFPESTILKSLRVLNRLRPAWPSLTSRQFEILGPVLRGVTAPRLLGTRTEPARVPDNDMFWDIVTKSSQFFVNRPLIPTEPVTEVYSWEVLDLLSVIGSSKLHGDNQPQQQSLLWSPLQIRSELAATVTITGSADTFDVETCETLLYQLWGEDGLDALRLVAAGAFLHIMSKQAYDTADTRVRSLTVGELNDDIIHILASRGYQRRAKQSAEEMVLDVLFGARADTIVSGLGDKPTFPFSTMSKKVLVIHCSSTSLALREALAWACAALRPHPSTTPGSTESSIRQSRGSFHTIGTDDGLGLRVWNLEPIEDIPVEDLGLHRCWTALFASGLIVPHEIRRQWGKGLGMSFDLMIHLSASETYIWVDDESANTGEVSFLDSHEDNLGTDLSNRSGGYILSGYRTALIPISISHGGTEIQWHLETSDDWTTIVDHMNLPSLKRDWLKVQDISIFQNAICYVGWYEKAVVLLGTDSVSQIPGWSGARTRDKSLHPASMAVQGGLTTAVAPSPVNGQMSVAKTYNWVSNVQRYEHSSEYNGAIRFERRKTALVVDHDKKRAYLVPKLSLMFHLCRVEALRSRTTPINPGPVLRPAIPAANPSVDGYQAALQVLQANENEIFIGSETTSDRMTLRQLFLEVHRELVKAAGLRESPRRLAILGTRIFATELLGLLDRPDTGTPLSEIQDPCLLAWVRMAELADAVLICSGLGSAIRPLTVGNDQECECHELPDGKYLLAAHMECIKVVLERQRSDIEDLGRFGVLDFGKGYKMRLNARRLWSQGNHGKHVSFWRRRKEIIQIIHKEDEWDGKFRRIAGRDGEADQTTATPHLTGVMVFGVRDWSF